MIPRIKKALKENGSPEPFFDFDEDRTFFEVDFYIHPAFKEEQTKVVPINNELLYVGERAIQVLDIIKSNSSVTASEIAEKIGILKRATEKHFSKLKSAGILDRIGSDKSGHWIIKSSL